MTEKPRKRALGRGLDALFGPVGAAAADIGGPETAAPAGDPARLPIELLRPGPDQPRKIFRPGEIRELADSIRAHGVIQPLVVRPDPEASPGQGWLIVAGERRWRAAQEAGLHEVPALVRNLDDETALEIAIVENLQRADLNAVEEAAALRQLIERFGAGPAEVARAIGKSRPYVANAVRLLALPQEVLDLVADGRLSAGHARALIGAADPAALARRVLADELTVRRTEDLARRLPEAAPRRRSAAARKDADTAALEADLAAALSLRVAIRHRGAEGGEVVLGYRSLEELDGLCRLLMR